MPRKKTNKIAAPAPTTNRPRYSEASFKAIVTAALRLKQDFSPFGFALPIPEVYGVNVLNGFNRSSDPSDMRAWARFDLTDGIGFTVWATRTDGVWSVEINPIVRLGMLCPSRAETYATAFALAAQAARLIRMKLCGKEPSNA